jgi:hypothetical protein
MQFGVTFVVENFIWAGAMFAGVLLLALRERFAAFFLFSGNGGAPDGFSLGLFAYPGVAAWGCLGCNGSMFCLGRAFKP